MAINNEDRQKIVDFIKNKSKNLYIMKPTEGGPCADLVRGIIETATGKKIANLEEIFKKALGKNPGEMYKKINTIEDFRQFCEDGDILYFVHNDDKKETIHYAIYCNIEDISRNVIGINGLMDLTFKSKCYKEIVASRIDEEAFSGNCFIYEKKENFEVCAELYVIKYDLEGTCCRI